MTDSKVIPYPAPAAARMARIAGLAEHAAMLLSEHHDALDLPTMLDLIERSSATFAELGILLLSEPDRLQMEATLVSLNMRIARARDQAG